MLHGLFAAYDGLCAEAGSLLRTGTPPTTNLLLLLLLLRVLRVFV